MVQLASAPNFRMVGGQRIAGGRQVRSGLLYRGDAVLSPGSEDAVALGEIGFVLVCDLRSESERTRAPNAWWRARTVDLLNLDLLHAIPTESGPWEILRKDATTAGARDAMRSVYAAFPKASLRHVAALFNRIAEGGLPLLIHCTAGKDRTGFLVALLLSALGVVEDEIMADYLASRGRYTPEVEEATRTMLLARADTDLDDAAIAAMMGVEEEYLRASFDVIARDYGGVEGYLAAAGVGPVALKRVRERLLA